MLGGMGWDVEDSSVVVIVNYSIETALQGWRQDGDIDVQGDVDFNASIPERPDPASCSGLTSAVISRPTTNCSTSAN